MFFVLLFFQAFAQNTLPQTEITATPLYELGFSKTIKPIEEIKYPISGATFSETLNFNSGLQSKTIGSPLLSVHGSQSNARVLVLLEGAPLNFSDGLGLDTLFVPTENINTVSVLKGSSSSTFGKDALAGAFNITTHSLQGADFRMSYSSFNTKELNLKYGVQDITTSVFHSHTDGNYSYSVPRLNSSGTLNNNDQETLRASIKINKNYFKTFHLISRQIGSSPGSVDYPSATRYNNVGHVHTLFGNYKFIKSLTTLSVSEKNYDGGGSKAQSLKQKTVFNFVYSTLEVELFNDLTFDQFNANYLLNGSQATRFNEMGLNLFYVLNNNTQLLGNVRYETESYQSLFAFGYNTEKEGWIYYFNLSQGFRPASLTQKFSQTSYYIGNPNLKPERSQEYSLGLKKDFLNFKFQMDVFLRDMTDLLENRVISTNLQQTQNTSSATAHGFDINLESMVASYLIGARLSYLQNRNNYTLEPIALSPQTQLGLTISRKLFNFNIQLESLYWDSFYDRNLTTGQLTKLPSWVILNFNVSTFINRNLEVLLSVFNLTDQARELTLGYPEQQRSFKISVRGLF